jgi:hypothetical protein
MDEMEKMQAEINDSIVKLWCAVWDLNTRLKKLEEDHSKKG